MDLKECKIARKVGFTTKQRPEYFMIPPVAKVVTFMISVVLILLINLGSPPGLYPNPCSALNHVFFLVLILLLIMSLLLILVLLLILIQIRPNHPEKPSYKPFFVVKLS